MLSKLSKNIILQKEINNLIEHNWSFLNKYYPTLEKKKHHITEPRDVDHIDDIKDTVCKKLGYIPTFFFLTVLYGVKDRVGPFRNIEKGLLLLYQLLEGVTINDMDEYIPHSTFWEIYKEFWYDDFNEINKKC